jgi:hypothetical protein
VSQYRKAALSFVKPLVVLVSINSISNLGYPSCCAGFFLHGDIQAG